MRENLYTQTVSKIKAPEGAVEKMLETAESFDKKEKVMHINNWIKGAVAASLAVAVSAGALVGFNPFGNKDCDSFIMTVGAAEITEKSFTPVGNLTITGGEISNESSNGFMITEEFDFDCLCKDDDVQSVTYTIENGSFSFSNKYDEEDQTYVIVKDADSNSFTVDYTDNKSQQSDDIHLLGVRLNMSLYENDNGLDKVTRQALADYKNHTRYIFDEETSSDYSEDDFNLKNCLETLYKTMLQKVKVNINVTFKGGEHQSKTMVFRCDSVDKDGISSFSAKLI